MRWNNWFYAGLGGILQSSEQGIEHQTTFGAGVGRYLKNNNVARISVLAGFSGQNTAYQQHIVAQNLASGIVAANLEFFRFDKTNGSVSAVLMPGISDPNRVKFNLNATGCRGCARRGQPRDAAIGFVETEEVQVGHDCANARF